MISLETMARCLNFWAGNLKFFPSDEAKQAGIGEELEHFVSTDEQLEWLRLKAVRTFSEWPGAMEIRAAFCSKFPPADGFEPPSTKYPDGIPSDVEQGVAPAKQLSAPKLPVLAVGPAIAAVSPECKEASETAKAVSQRRLKRSLNDSDRAPIRHLYTKDGFPK